MSSLFRKIMTELVLIERFKRINKDGPFEKKMVL